MAYHIYILQSIQTGRLYIGQTANLVSRLDRHNAGSVPSTKPYRPWNLIFSKEFLTRTEAIKEENRLKKLKSKDYILKYISAKASRL
ncbi:MAG: hypothetical protein A2X64_08250 [Ignavibacteria bacterium GWF2_33_9]|nr:MAG: hypothetical protein A2X64_08250 [Ignavibacteria bacterium GWF2_33_9]